MRILFLGDIHGEIELLKEAIKKAKENKCDRIIQVGDFGLFPYLYSQFIKDLNHIDNNIDIYWIDGNHENHEVIQSYKYSPLPTPLSNMEIDYKGGNIFYIPRGYTEILNNQKILYIGGADSIDKNSRTPGMDWWHEEKLTNKDYIKCIEKENIDIVISHDCPQNRVITHPNEGSREILTAIVEKLNPKILIHGHHHLNYSCIYMNTGTIFIGLGMNSDNNTFIFDL